MPFDDSKFYNAVLNYIAAQTGATYGVGGTVFAVTMPSKPDNVIVLSPSGGPRDPADPTRRRTFQILVRNSSASGALATARAIFNSLNDKWNILTDFPGRIVPMTEMGAHWADDSKLTVFSLNFVYVGTLQ